VGWTGSSELLRDKPSGIREVHRGDNEPYGNSERGELALPARRLEAVSNGCDHCHLADDEAEHLDLSEVRKSDEDEHEAHQRKQRSNHLNDIIDPPTVLVHRLFSFKVQFSTTLLSQRLSVYFNSDNSANVAYMGLKSSPIEKARILGLFLGFRIGLKNFLPPKLNINWSPSEASLTKTL
jgi:hypothetical protein